jgi:hypothetical protein
LTERQRPEQGGVDLVGGQDAVIVEPAEQPQITAGERGLRLQKALFIGGTDYASPPGETPDKDLSQHTTTIAG